MSRKVNWGVLGTADIAKKCTIPAMQKAVNCNLYAIAGRTKEKAEDYKDTYGFEKAYYSYDELLDDEKVEAVYIPLPNVLHKDWVIKAAKKGKHILCEKPIAKSEAELKELIEVCNQEGVILMEAFAYLHSPAVKEVKEVLDSGIIGKPTVVETTFLTPAPPSTDIRMNKETLGGAVYDLGCYNISLILTMLGEEPKDVKAVAHFTEKGIDDYTAAIMEFSDGVRATVVTGMCSGQRADHYYIYGTEGSLEVPIPYNEEGTLNYYIHKEGKTEEKTVTAPDNYMLEVEQLGRCITDGEKPYVSNEFSLRNARTIDKVLASIGY